MAWLTTYTDTNKIEDDYREFQDERTYIPVIGVPTVQRRDVTQTDYLYPGMSNEAARTAVTAINDPPLTTATSKRTGAAGSYSVYVCARTEGEWSSDLE